MREVVDKGVDREPKVKEGRELFSSWNASGKEPERDLGPIESIEK
jgi:hypothetical protein